MYKSKSVSLIFNCLLACAVFFVCWLALELLFPFVLPYLPLQMHGYLPSEIVALAQNSKRGLIPYDYIAIAGDSYSLGAGDGLLDRGPFSNPRTCPAHILSRATGRDVIAVGRSGAGNPEGLVHQPVLKIYCPDSLLWFSGMIRRAMERPDVMLLFFYEGNDLDDVWTHDDMGDEGKSCLEWHKTGLDCFWCHVSDGGLWAEMGLWDRLLFSRFVRACLLDPEKLRMDRGVNTFLGRGGKAAATPGKVNRVRVAGRTVAVPDGLQSPALCLTDREIEIGFAVFEESLDYVKKFFPDSEIIVVYVPSPLSCYEIASSEVSIETSIADRDKNYPAVMVGGRNGFMTRRVREAAAARGMAFVDTLPAVREAARGSLLHGPRDWLHFNLRGYGVMLGPVIAALKALPDKAEKDSP